MASKDEAGILILLLSFGAALYAATWLLAGPPGDRGTPLVSPLGPTVQITLSAR
jgi:hypothetical protein